MPDVEELKNDPVKFYEHFFKVKVHPYQRKLINMLKSNKKSFIILPFRRRRI